MSHLPNKMAHHRKIEKEKKKTQIPRPLQNKMDANLPFRERGLVGMATDPHVQRGRPLEWHES